jgi:Zn-dependent peptidase ImmA (M78 family)/transcriptional regulator with XRE-family HTH domain
MTSVGVRVRQQREALGLSVADMAGLAQLEVADLEAAEADQQQLSWGGLVQVARALVINPEVLLGHQSQPALQLRCRTPDGAAVTLGGHDTRLLALAARTARAVWPLAKALDKPSTVHARRAPRPVAAAERPGRQGYALGEMARPWFTEDMLPIPSVQGLLERHGVHVGFLELSNAQIDAVALIDDDMVPLVLLNRRSPRSARSVTRRAVIGHELCHLLFDAGLDVHNLVHVSFHTWNVDIEQRARAFAPSFLAPPVTLSRGASEGGQDLVRRLAATWGLSFEGAVWHAKNAGLLAALDPDELLTWAKAASVDGDFEHVPARHFTPDLVEAEDIEPFVVGLLAELVVQAAQEDLITPARAREILRGAP